MIVVIIHRGRPFALPGYVPRIADLIAHADLYERARGAAEA